MLFNSIEFFIFFTFVIAVLVLVAQRRYQLVFLLGASYFFYYSSSSIFIFLLLLVSIITFVTGEAIYRARSPREKKIYLALGTAGVLSMLGFFKYFNFGSETISALASAVGIQLSLPVLSLVLPIGISFYSFSALSYVFDIYRGEFKPTGSFCKFSLFIAYFPHLLAGPIVRASQFLPQLRHHVEIRPENVKSGITIIAWGFVKKFVIADNIAPLVNPIFGQPSIYSSFDILFAVFFFGIQIYCDFSGYIDIALGLARIIGLHLPLNFFRPYLTKNPTEFWRRWNITLSSFIRDYVYIPLGGNRKGSVRTYANLMISMLLCGLWHGAAWNFIIWGGYHGLLLSADKMLNRKMHIADRSAFLSLTHAGYMVKILINQCFIFFGWLIFRVGDLSNLFYCMEKILFFDFNLTMTKELAIAGTTLGFAAFLILLFHRGFADRIVRLMTTDWVHYFSMLPLRYWTLYLAGMILIFLSFSPASHPQFIYYQF